jgi:hypothetical protein
MPTTTRRFSSHGPVRRNPMGPPRNPLGPLTTPPDITPTFTTARPVYGRPGSFDTGARPPGPVTRPPRSIPTAYDEPPASGAGPVMYPAVQPPAQPTNHWMTRLRDSIPPGPKPDPMDAKPVTKPAPIRQARATPAYEPGLADPMLEGSIFRGRRRSWRP